MCYSVCWVSSIMFAGHWVVGWINNSVGKVFDIVSVFSPQNPCYKKIRKLPDTMLCVPNPALTVAEETGSSRNHWLLAKVI